VIVALTYYAHAGPGSQRQAANVFAGMVKGGNRDSKCQVRDGCWQANYRVSTLRRFCVRGGLEPFSSHPVRTRRAGTPGPEHRGCSPVTVNG